MFEVVLTIRAAVTESRAVRIRRRSFPLVLSICLLALLALAATASAETRVGEATGLSVQSVPGEANILKAVASFDSSTGAQRFEVTTRSAPLSELEAGEKSSLTLGVALTTVRGSCDVNAFTGEKPAVYPVFAINASYEKPEGETPEAFYGVLGSSQGGPEESGAAAKTVTGATTTLAAAAPKAVNGPYNCAVAQVLGAGEEKQAGTFLAFPIAVPVAPGPAIPTAPTPAPVVPAAPRPPASSLLLGKLKPLSLAVGEWGTVRVKVSYDGASAAGPVAIKAKAPVGVTTKPGTLKLPALLPGQSWTLPLRVKLTEKAKKRSTIRLTGTVPGLTATGSVVVKSVD